MKFMSTTTQKRNMKKEQTEKQLDKFCQPQA